MKGDDLLLLLRPLVLFCLIFSLNYKLKISPAAKDFIAEKFNSTEDSQLIGLDIGSGANGIYCILGAQHFNWKMVGSETDSKALEIANSNIKNTKGLNDRIEIRHQKDKGSLFKNTIQPNEQFDFVVCNPPFHSSKEEALKGSLRKVKNLGGYAAKEKFLLNFEGQANELWCNGGEVLFIKIDELEQKGEDITRQTNLELSKNFITPFDREDIHSLITSIDLFRLYPGTCCIA